MPILVRLGIIINNIINMENARIKQALNFRKSNELCRQGIKKAECNAAIQLFMTISFY